MSTPVSLDTSRPLAIVVSQYNESITNNLLQGAQSVLREQGFDDRMVRVVRVPGAWEIPLAAKWLADSGLYQAIVCLGAVIRGETTHDQHLNRFVCMALGELSMQTGIPVGLGVLTCNDLQQAVQRSGGKVGNKGIEATEAVISMLRLKVEIAD